MSHRYESYSMYSNRMGCGGVSHNGFYVLPPLSLTKLQGADTQTDHIFADLRHLEKENDKCNLPKVPMMVIHVMNYL